eukprot:gene5315-biopygen23690
MLVWSRDPREARAPCGGLPLTFILECSGRQESEWDVYFPFFAAPRRRFRSGSAGAAAAWAAPARPHASGGMSEGATGTPPLVHTPLRTHSGRVWEAPAAPLLPGSTAGIAPATGGVLDTPSSVATTSPPCPAPPSAPAGARTPPPVRCTGSRGRPADAGQNVEGASGALGHDRCRFFQTSALRVFSPPVVTKPARDAQQIHSPQDFRHRLRREACDGDALLRRGDHVRRGLFIIKAPMIRAPRARPVRIQGAPAIVSHRRMSGIWRCGVKPPGMMATMVRYSRKNVFILLVMCCETESQMSKISPVTDATLHQTQKCSQSSD